MSRYTLSSNHGSQNRRSWRDIDPGDHIKLAAELAKRNIQLSDADQTYPRNVLLEERNKLRRVVNDLRDESLQAINRKDNTKADELMNVMGSVQLLIGKFEEQLDLQEINSEQLLIRNGGARQASSNSPRLAMPPGSWKAQDGRSISVLSPNDRFIDTIRNDGLQPTANFGDVIRGMALGTSHPDIRAALTEGTDSAGGYTVPTILLAQIIDTMRARTTVIQAGAMTIPLDTLKTNIARLATDPVSAWRAENGAIGESDPTFESVQFVAKSLAVMVKLSRELLEDTVNLNDALLNAFAGSMAVELDRAALFGSGTPPEPRGVFNTTGIGSVSMGTNGAALTSFDKVIDLVQILQDAKAPDPTAAIMAPRTSTAIAKLKDTTNQPLRKPEALANLPFMVTTQVPITQTQGTASNASCIIAGDFSQVMIGIRSSLRIELLRELYAGTNQYAFVAHLRADIQVAKPGALAKLIGVIP